MTKNCLDGCNLKNKVSICCGMHPETLGIIKLEINEEVISICPNLSENGLCIVYENRPDICKTYFCLDLKLKNKSLKNFIKERMGVYYYLSDK